jgi:hypothetical protein
MRLNTLIYADAGAHTKVAAGKLPSDSSDDDASIIEVKLDKSLHQEFQDADYYKFEDDRTEERIKKDQVCFSKFKLQDQVGSPYSVRTRFCHEHVLGFDLLHAMEVSNLCHILPL